MRFLPVVILLSSAVAGAMLVVACSDSSSPGVGPEVDGGGGGSADAPISPAVDGEVPLEDGAVPLDGATNADACAPAPSLDAGGGCGTMEFGAPASAFGPVVGGSTYVGGTLQAGVYDATGAERASGTKGSWRETFAVDGAGHFTRIRQIDTGISDASLGPVTRRSGTYTTNGTTITLTYDCAQNDGVVVDAGMDSLPFDALASGSCGASYRYGATGIRITLTRR